MYGKLLPAADVAGAGRPAARARARRDADARRRGERAGALGRRRATTRSDDAVGFRREMERARLTAAERAAVRPRRRPARRLRRALERREHRARGDEQRAERAVHRADVVRLRAAGAARAPRTRVAAHHDEVGEHQRRAADRVLRQLRPRGSMNCGSTASMNTMPLGFVALTRKPAHQELARRAAQRPLRRGRVDGERRRAPLLRRRATRGRRRRATSRP